MNKKLEEGKQYDLYYKLKSNGSWVYISSVSTNDGWSEVHFEERKGNYHR